MSVSTLQSLFQYAIANLGQAFTPACPIQNYSDFVLTYTNLTTLADTSLVLNVDYFVTGAFVNGVLTAPTVTLEGTGLHYAVGGQLTIQRKPPETQPTTLVDGTKYLAATTNNALDWVVYQIQALSDMLARTLRLPATNSVQSEIPLASRALKFLGFDANGNFALFSTLPSNDQVNTAIQNFTGGVAGCLDYLPTTGLSLNSILTIQPGGPQQGLVRVQICASTAAAIAGVIIRPLDYNAGTNARQWYVVG